jgi:hypothetical protein
MHLWLFRSRICNHSYDIVRRGPPTVVGQVKMMAWKRRKMWCASWVSSGAVSAKLERKIRKRIRVARNGSGSTRYCHEVEKKEEDGNA